jgi:hypothetical protein
VDEIPAADALSPAAVEPAQDAEDPEPTATAEVALEAAD